jgi:hypothetical protein
MPNTDLKTIHTLEKKIAAARRRLQTLYDSYGYTSAEVLAASIELDELFNQYQKIADDSVTE